MTDDDQLIRQVWMTARLNAKECKYNAPTSGEDIQRMPELKKRGRPFFLIDTALDLLGYPTNHGVPSTDSEIKRYFNTVYKWMYGRPGWK